MLNRLKVLVAEVKSHSLSKTFLRYKFIMDKKLYFTKAEEMSLSDATKPLLVVSRLVGMNPKSNWHKIYTASILAYEFFLIIYVWEFHCRRIIPSLYFNVLVHALKDLCRTSSSLVIFFFSFVDRNR